MTVIITVYTVRAVLHMNKLIRLQCHFQSDVFTHTEFDRLCIEGGVIKETQCYKAQSILESLVLLGLVECVNKSGRKYRFREDTNVLTTIALRTKTMENTLAVIKAGIQS